MRPIERLKDRLFGKRYREGWPRGVVPMFPPAININRYLQKHYPFTWEKMKHMPAYDALVLLQDEGIITGVTRDGLQGDVRIVGIND